MSRSWASLRQELERLEKELSLKTTAGMVRRDFDFQADMSAVFVSRQLDLLVRGMRAMAAASRP
ncbi:hypothetical protein [Cohnella caldifontis]|uniref:hypothetical protein n=1 Tax=Cohnella caldifontis TaxID=3027471 RepID=UPI0023EB13F3|nr:hypothetical protein [Cohnella sp. YIM B05605]